MVFLIQSIEKQNGRLVIITPNGKKLYTNGRLSIKHADPERIGYQAVDAPLFKPHRQQIVCETDKSEVALRNLLAQLAVTQRHGQIGALPDDVRGVVTEALPPEMVEKIDQRTGNIL